MNVHSTINLYRHTGGERQIARGGSDLKVFGHDLINRSVADDNIETAPGQSDNDAAADPAHATRHSRDSVRQTWIHIYLPLPFCLRVK
jgi:hypothetical protein